MMEVPEAFMQQSCSIGLIGESVTIYCETRADAEQVMDWLCDVRVGFATDLAAEAANRDEVERLREALHWALPLAERAVDDHRLLRLQHGHTDIIGTYKNGRRSTGIHQSEVDQIEAARDALKRGMELDPPLTRAQELAERMVPIVRLWAERGANECYGYSEWKEAREILAALTQGEQP